MLHQCVVYIFSTKMSLGLCASVAKFCRSDI